MRRAAAEVVTIDGAQVATSQRTFTQSHTQAYVKNRKKVSSCGTRQTFFVQPDCRRRILGHNISAERKSTTVVRIVTSGSGDESNRPKPMPVFNAVLGAVYSTLSLP